MGSICHTADFTAKPYAGRKSTVSPELDKKIIEKIEGIPSTTLKELIEEFNLGITESGLLKRLEKMGYTF